jgi:diguanylate cyclase (GGDEF)-like protein
LHLEGGATGALQTSDGQLWFASADGLMRYDPRREYINNTRPLVHMESVLADGRPLERGAEIPRSSSSLELHFAGLSFQDESAVRFRYRLKGLKDEWSGPVSRRTVTYANLDGGTYTFEVEARNPHGIWSSEPATFEFSVAAPYWTRVEFWALAAALITLLLWSAYMLRMRQVEARRQVLERQVADRTRELATANRRLEEASVTDPMTGLFNRRFLMKQIGADVAQVRRSHREADLERQQDLVFMMVDLDNFKTINDRWGHAAGDRVLRAFAGLIQNEMRESDYVVRWGGEEFLVVARQTERGSSGAIAQRILDATRDHAFDVNDGGERIHCSCSIGIAHLPFLKGCPDALGWEQVLDLADSAVYRAKAMGRDRWVRISAGPALSSEECEQLADILVGELDAHIQEDRIRVEESGSD